MTFYFQIETSGNDTNSISDADKDRGIEAAITYCAAQNIDADKAYAEFISDDASDEAIDQWMRIESAAFDAMFKGWARQPESVCLTGFTA